MISIYHEQKGHAARVVTATIVMWNNLNHISSLEFINTAIANPLNHSRFLEFIHFFIQLSYNSLRRAICLLSTFLEIVRLTSDAYLRESKVSFLL